MILISKVLASETTPETTLGRSADAAMNRDAFRFEHPTWGEVTA
jgi:hypothetical protein